MQIQIANYDFIPPEIILNGLQYIPKVTEIKEEIEKKDDLSSYDNLIKLVEEFEGFFSKAYKCPAKVWTIGFGTTIYSNGRTVKEGDTITREKAYSEMMFELDKKWKGISRYITVPTNKNQQSALISFAYNCGIGAFAGSTLLKKLNLGLYKEIPNELLKWTKGGGVHLKGLWRRRLSEALLFNSENKFIVPLSKVPDGWVNIRIFNENMKKLAI